MSAGVTVALPPIHERDDDDVSVSNQRIRKAWAEKLLKQAPPPPRPQPPARRGRPSLSPSSHNPTVEWHLGLPTEVFHRTVVVAPCYHPRRQYKVLHVFFIPGNPGTLHFYLAFLDLLAHTLAAAAPKSLSLAPYAAICVHGCGHAMHHLDTMTTATAATATAWYKDGRKQWQQDVGWGLDQQTHHTAAFIEATMDARALYEPVGGVYDHALMFIGHSIGAYIGLQLLQKSQALRSRCQHVLLLMPFIGWSRLAAAHRAKLMAFVRFHPVSQRVAEVLARPLVRLPRSVKRSLVALTTGHADDIVTAVADGLACDRVVTNFLTMGVEEVRDVRAHEEHIAIFLGELDRQRDMDVFLCYTNDDVWAPLDDADAFARSLTAGGTTVRVEPGLTHAFSLTHVNTRRMVAIIEDHFVQGRERRRHGVIRSRL